MKYFIDIQSYKYKKQIKLLGLNIGKPIFTVDLISIGIVSENHKYIKEYYAISKDFDIKATWNNKWLRENILKLIFEELLQLSRNNEPTFYNKINDIFTNDYRTMYFNYRNFKRLINKYGKTNKQIVEEIINFFKNNVI